MFNKDGLFGENSKKWLLKNFGEERVISIGSRKYIFKQPLWLQQYRLSIVSIFIFWVIYKTNIGDLLLSFLDTNVFPYLGQRFNFIFGEVVPKILHFLAG